MKGRSCPLPFQPLRSFFFSPPYKQDGVTLSHIAGGGGRESVFFIHPKPRVESCSTQELLIWGITKSLGIVTAILGHLDYIWNSLIPNRLSTLMRTFFN